MADPKGFMKYPREGPKRRPVELRVLDWKEFYEPMAEDALKAQGARCMDCGVPFCPPYDQQLSGIHRPAVPGAMRKRLRARDQRGAGVDSGHRMEHHR